MTLYQFGPVGSLVVGSFEATVVANGMHILQGKFAVCRLPDELAP